MDVYAAGTEGVRFSRPDRRGPASNSSSILSSSALLSTGVFTDSNSSSHSCSGTCSFVSKMSLRQ